MLHEVVVDVDFISILASLVGKIDLVYILDTVSQITSLQSRNPDAPEDDLMNAAGQILSRDLAFTILENLPIIPGFQ